MMDSLAAWSNFVRLNDAELESIKELEAHLEESGYFNETCHEPEAKNSVEVEEVSELCTADLA